MKTNRVERQYEANSTSRAEFRITQGAKIFEMLISGLYADKAQSITREIWSNAYDAHVESGLAHVPFDVVFPSRFSPIFRTRDYGPSMDHDTIMVLYTDLGMSSKEDSNDGIGKFGIGSKSPFAYTDNFTVIAYHNGTKRMYSAIRENGAPAMHFLGEMPTDEPNGIEVSFPVERNDIERFRAAAKRVSYGFDVKPRVVRPIDAADPMSAYEEDTAFEGWPEIEALSEGDGWKLLKSPISGYSGRTYAKMGPVLYPVDSSQLDVDDVTKQLLDTNNILLEFEIGELEITPSRESLSYGNNEPTSAALRKRTESIISSMADKYLEPIKNASTYYEACTEFNNVVMSYGIPAVVMEKVKKAVWNGRKLMSYFELNTVEYPGLSFGEIGSNKIHNAAYRYDPSHVSPRYSKNTMFLIEDMTISPAEKRVPARLHKYRRESASPINHIVWIRFNKRRRAALSMIQLLDMLDGANVMLASDLPEITKEQRSRRPVQVRELRYGGFQSIVSLDAEAREKGGYYVKLERMTVVKPIEVANARPVVLALQSVGAIPNGVTIYGVPKTLWADFEGDEWIDVYELAKETLEKYSVHHDEAVRRRAVSKVANNNLYKFVQERVSIKELSDKSPLAAFVHSVRNLQDTVFDAEVRKYEEIAHIMGVEYDDADNTIIQDVEQRVEYLLVRYPLLEAMVEIGPHPWGSSKKVVDRATHYVQMCDQALTK